MKREIMKNLDTGRVPLEKLYEELLVKSNELEKTDNAACKIAFFLLITYS